MGEPSNRRAGALTCPAATATSPAATATATAAGHHRRRRGRWITIVDSAAMTSSGGQVTGTWVSVIESPGGDLALCV